MKKLALLIAFALLVFAAFLTGRKHANPPAAKPDLRNSPGATTFRKVIISEAARTLLYLPLYHADKMGYFREADIDVTIITAGTATAAFASMLSGEAEFAQADPMYVPISREKGSDTKVVAQVVGRIAVWGVTLDPNVREMSATTIKGKRIATHPRPMTAFTYTTKFVRDLGLDPDKDVEFITSTPGAEIASLFNRQADFMVTVEPNATKAEMQGAHVILSFATRYGDQVLTGLMAKESFLQAHPRLALSVVRAYQRALDDIRKNPTNAVASAKAFFPQLEEPVLRSAIKRLTDEDVFPKSVLISDESWAGAIGVRVAVGDLRAASPREQNCDLELMSKASSP